MEIFVACLTFCPKVLIHENDNDNISNCLIKVFEILISNLKPIYKSPNSYLVSIYLISPIFINLIAT